MVCGIVGTYEQHLQDIDQVIGLRSGVQHFYAMNAIMLPKRTVFICDTYVNLEPTAEQIAEMTVLAAAAIRRFRVISREIYFAPLAAQFAPGTSSAPG